MVWSSNQWTKLKNRRTGVKKKMMTRLEEKIRRRILLKISTQ